MVPQLSTTARDSQPNNAIRFHYLANQVGKLCLLGLLAAYSALSVGQATDLGVRIEPLTAVDQQFMSEQRVRVEQLANRLGRNLSGQAMRDIDTLQRLLDDGLVLTAIDQQFMSDQRVRVEQLANRLGRNLSGQATRDIDTLQRLLDDGLVSSTDTLTLQAMGVVFGDLLGNHLDMNWIIYRDNAGRSRALRHRNADVTLFPMTMISRRHQNGSTRRLQSLYDETIADIRPLLPGGKWLP